MSKFSNAPLFVDRQAYFSDDRKYRYWLDIVWDSTKTKCAFVGLNPSTADETRDDPTIRRCRGFAERLGCGGMRMLNLFSFRATDPQVMKAESDPVGDRNDLIAFVKECDGPIIACWGTHGSHMGRDLCVKHSFGRVLQCFGKNADGSPKHPLYLKSTTPLESL